MKLTSANITTILNTLKFIAKNPKILLIIFPLIGAYYSYEVFVAREKMALMGVPNGTTFSNKMVRIFRNDDFMIGYSESKKNPLWVIYRIKKVPKNAQRLKRPSSFSVDTRTFTRVKHDDYTGSGYDRGHMAPNYAIASLYGKDSQLDTFLMSNITPQKPDLNRKLWQRLEEAEIKYFTKLDDEIWVITGAIFDDKIEKLKSGVEIPDSFYKVYAMEKNGKFNILGFIMPQNVRGNERLDEFVASIDEIEKLSGFDFFHKMKDNIENELESKIDMDSWNLKKVANIKGRY